MTLDGVRLGVEPPTQSWRVAYHYGSGGFAGTVLTWFGPSGVRRDTLKVLIYQVGQGTLSLRGAETAWRQYRTPNLEPQLEPFFKNTYLNLEGGTSDAFLWTDSSARFYVIPVGEELTVPVAAYEARCACLSTPHELEDGDQGADETEIELSMWLEELEALLAGISFEEP